MDRFIILIVEKHVLLTLVFSLIWLPNPLFISCHTHYSKINHLYILVLAIIDACFLPTKITFRCLRYLKNPRILTCCTYCCVTSLIAQPYTWSRGSLLPNPRSAVKNHGYNWVNLDAKDGSKIDNKRFKEIMSFCSHTDGDHYRRRDCLIYGKITALFHSTVTICLYLDFPTFHLSYHTYILPLPIIISLICTNGYRINLFCHTSTEGSMDRN